MHNMPIGSALGRAGAAARVLLLGAGLLILLAGCVRPGAESPGNSGQNRALARALAYSKCMRAHGVSKFPDPTSNGNGITMKMNRNEVDPNSPQFKAAQQACHKLQPGPASLTPAQQAQLKKDDLAMARCMRAHGFPNFPDPNGQGVIVLTPSDGVNQNSSQFQSALKGCQKGDTAIQSNGGTSGSGQSGAKS
jgi:hypothetical protein